MPIATRDLVQDEGGLWEFGVVLPLANMDMSKFEEQTFLSEDVLVDDTKIRIPKTSIRIKVNSRYYVGPSSDPTRDNGELLYQGNSETFRVLSITDLGDEWEIENDVLGPGFIDRFQNRYLKGDPVTFRTLSRSWDFIRDGEFPDLSVTDPDTDTLFTYSREDSFDGFKAFSQGISVDDDLTAINNVGISQVLNGANAKILSLLKDKGIAISAWVRVQVANKYTPLNPLRGLVLPFMICSFYDYPEAVAANAIDEFTFSFGTDQIPEKSWDVFMDERVRAPSNPMSMRLGVYGAFFQSEDSQERRIHIDNIVAEHIVGTSQETNGRYKVDINPAIGVSFNQSGGRSTQKFSTGEIRDLGLGDPTLRLDISALWQNRPGYFINDLRKIEEWNKLGFPIALRTKMPGYMPNVIFCNMEVSVNPRRSLSNQRADVQVRFREIAV